jgi:hypothetical protein
LTTTPQTLVGTRAAVTPVEPRRAPRRVYPPRVRLFAVLLAGLAFLAGSEVRGGIIFTDWTTVDTTNNTASGTLGPVSVSFTGGIMDFGVTNGTFTGFNQPFFSPPLALTDVVGFRGSPSDFTYTIAFDRPVKDPRLDLASLASTLTFPGITLTKLSGQDTFTVSGSTVSGVIGGTLPPPNNDANGTVLLNGTFTTISFTADYPFSKGDGIALQVGADFAAPEPASMTLLGIGAVGLIGYGWRHRRSRWTPPQLHG